jgi:lipoate-protein ligase A
MHLIQPRAAVGAPLPDFECGWKVIGVPGISSVESGLARQQALADEIAVTGRPLFVVWRCHQALLASRTETRLPGFQQACVELAATGWPVALRKSGGGACPVGPGTVQLSTIEVAAPDATMQAKYAVLAAFIQSTLRAFGIDSEIGPVVQAYCTGRFDVAVQGRKIAGMSQHWFRNSRGVRCTVTAASINVEEPPEVLAAVLNRFYRRAGSPLHCETNAISNMRLCSPSSGAADQNLVTRVNDSLIRIVRTSGAFEAAVAFG